MPADIIYALHGFLGCATDWAVINRSLPDTEFIAEELFSHQPVRGLPALQNSLVKKIFLGYSLGGRIGLNMLKSDPTQFDHYVFLSTHPGLSESDSVGRAQRLESDKQWAQKITSENWNTFLKSWNNQPVFAGSSVELSRSSDDFDLYKLREALVGRSLGLQPDYSAIIREHQQKITWVVGDRDSKFCQIADELKNKKILSKVERISSGHRIWQDNPQSVVALLKELIR